MASIIFLVMSSCCCRAASGINLPLGDINAVVVTDVHSWVGGHRAHEAPAMDADYGDVLSFHEHLLSLQTNGDVFLVNNGDFMDGTGLSTYPPIHLEPILQKMPWDAVTVGNHDVYKNETVEFMTRSNGGLTKAPYYLSSNVVDRASGKPIGKRYRYLQGKHATVLTFGFLYDLQVASSLVRVERVYDVVRQDWFLKSLRAKSAYDAILVLAHMGVDDPAINIIFSAIRKETGPVMPIQFITGHTHHRRYTVLDKWSTAFEAGRYLDTVGFVSFPTKQTAMLVAADNVTASLFQHEFLDANVETLKNRLGIDTLKTSKGQALTDFIHKTQDEMGLSRVVGCSPQNYYMNRTLYDEDSLFGLWARHVIAELFLDEKRLVLQGTSSSFRYDLFEGSVTLDDLMIVSPFNDSMYLIGSNVPVSDIVELNKTMNRKRNIDHPGLPDFILIGNLTTRRQSYDLYTLEYEVPFLQRALENISGKSLAPRPINVYATSLWISFVEQHWASCESTSKNHVGADKRQPYVAYPPASGAFPNTLAILMSLVPALSALLLLVAFVMKRIPFHRKSALDISGSNEIAHI